MAYEKKTWVKGSTPLSAENFNHIEQGVADAHNAITQLNSEIKSENAYQKVGIYRIATKSTVLALKGTNYYAIAGQNDLKILLGLDNVYTNKLSVIVNNADYGANTNLPTADIENSSGLVKSVNVRFSQLVTGNIRINATYIYCDN